MNRATSIPEPIADRTACSSGRTSSGLIVSWANIVRDRFSRSAAASHSLNSVSFCASKSPKGRNAWCSVAGLPASQEQAFDDGLDHLVGVGGDRHRNAQ